MKIVTNESPSARRASAPSRRSSSLRFTARTLISVVAASIAMLMFTTSSVSAVNSATSTISGNWIRTEQRDHLVVVLEPDCTW